MAYEIACEVVGVSFGKNLSNWLQINDVSGVQKVVTKVLKEHIGESIPISENTSITVFNGKKAKEGDRVLFTKDMDKGTLVIDRMWSVAFDDKPHLSYSVYEDLDGPQFLELLEK